MSRSLSSSCRGRCSTYRTCWQMLGRRVLVQEEECLTSSSNSVIRVLPKKSTGRTLPREGSPISATRHQSGFLLKVLAKICMTIVTRATSPKAKWKIMPSTRNCLLCHGI